MRPGEPADPRDVDAELDDLDRRLMAEPTDQHELDDIHRRVADIRACDGLTAQQAAQADVILSFFKDRQAEQRHDRRVEQVAVDYGARAHAYDRAVREIGFTPPTMTGMILKNKVTSGRLSEEALQDILSAMKHDTETGEWPSR